MSAQGVIFYTFSFVHTKLFFGIEYFIFPATYKSNPKVVKHMLCIKIFGMLSLDFKKVKLVGGGSAINRAYPVKLVLDSPELTHVCTESQVRATPSVPAGPTSHLPGEALLEAGLVVVIMVRVARVFWQV